MRRIVRCLVLGCCLVAGALAPAHARRLALVIGNDKYQQVTQLQKAGNDAEAMARELRAAGFDVTLHKDLAFRPMVKAIETMIGSIAGGDEVVFFYAGHGVQIKSGGYMLPTDIEATTESEVEKFSYGVNDLMDKVGEAKASFALFLVDACRDNPLKGKNGGRSVGGTRGLNPPEPAKGQMVVYSASRGQQALDRLADNDTNPNGVFTREFISRMRRPGVRVEDLVREVQDSVESLARSVSHEQRPSLYNEARGNFYFYGPTTLIQMPASPPPIAVVAAPAPGQPAPIDSREDGFWKDARDSGNREAYEAYLDLYPSGRYAKMAGAFLARLGSPAAAKPGVAGPAPAPAPTTSTAPNPTSSPVIPAAGLQTASSPVAPPALATAAAPTSIRPAAPLASPPVAVAPAPEPAQVALAVRPPAPTAGARPATAATGTRAVGHQNMPNGDKYDGDLVGMVRTGKGTYTFASGERYEGDVLDNEFHGTGTWTHANGDVYQGQFVHGVKQGQGINKFANGDRYEGEFVNHSITGKGSMFHANGDRYDGEFSAGSKQGAGVYRFASGDRFEGTFANNLFNGKGKLLLANGERYEGGFRDNMKEGAGVHYFVGGARYEGNFAGGVASGSGTYFYANGDFYVGEFRNGTHHGKGVYHFANGQLKEMEFVNGAEKAN